LSITTFGSRGTREDRQQVSEFQQRSRELRSQLAAAQQRVEEARVAFASDKGSATEVAEAANERDRVQLALRDVESGQRQLLGKLAPGAVNGFGGHEADPSAMLSEQFGDPEFLAMMERVAQTKGKLGGEIDLGRIPRETMVKMFGSKIQAATGGTVTPSSSMGVGPFDGIIPLLQPATAIYDLIPTDSYDHAVLPYSQEISETGDPGPAPAAPGTMKPAMGIGYEDVTTASTTIAGWVKTQRQAVADQSLLLGSINNRALVKLKQAIEAALLTADGTVSDAAGVTGIKGLLNTTGIASVDATGMARVDALLAGIKAILAVGGSPNAIALSLTDWEDLLTSKATGSGEYVANPFVATARSVWGVSFVPSVKLSAGQALVADTRLAATLLFREGATIRMSDSDQDDFVRNNVTILVEARVLLPVWQPSAVAEVTNLGS
jgi:Phage capsid family